MVFDTPSVRGSKSAILCLLSLSSPLSYSLRTDLPYSFLFGVSTLGMNPVVIAVDIPPRSYTLCSSDGCFPSTFELIQIVLSDGYLI